MEWGVVLADLAKAATGGLLALIGTWAVVKVQKKAASTEVAFGVSDRWKGWAEALERRVASEEAAGAKLRVEVEALREEVASVKASLTDALDWIEWAMERLHALGVAIRPLPVALARMLRRRQDEEDGA